MKLHIEFRGCSSDNRLVAENYKSVLLNYCDGVEVLHTLHSRWKSTRGRYSPLSEWAYICKKAFTVATKGMTVKQREQAKFIIHFIGEQHHV